MTDRIKEMFAANKSRGRKALITFVTTGDPDIETTKRLVLVMEKAGADLIELGVPFSDPVAEGPVIQQADIRALKNSIKIDDIFNMVETLRRQTDMPLVFMMYANCVLNYNVEKFFKRCLETGVDGVIVPDLPYEEREDFAPSARTYGIKLVSLVAPTSHERIKKIAGAAEGFLYCVSSLGVTGTRKEFDTDFDSFFGTINKYAKVPTALGFGISTPQQVQALKKYADGIIVGSAIVKIIGGAKNADEALSGVSAFVKSLRDALDAD